MARFVIVIVFYMIILFELMCSRDEFILFLETKIFINIIMNMIDNINDINDSNIINIYYLLLIIVAINN